MEHRTPPSVSLCTAIMIYRLLDCNRWQAARFADDRRASRASRGAEPGTSQPSSHAIWPGHARPAPEGFQYLVIVSDLRRYGRAADRHAARSYSWIRPPRTLRRRTRTAGRPVTGPVMMAPLSGGRSARARWGRWRL